MSVCFFKFFFGWDCPACGLLRSVVALTSGNFEESVVLHPMGVLVVMWLLNFWWWRKFRISQASRNIVSHAILIGFFVPWLFGLYLNIQ